MQNNSDQQSGKMKKFFKDKGYYIVLALCVMAVGVSGYLFLSTANEARQTAAEVEETLSVPLTPAPKNDEKKTPAKPAAALPGKDAAEAAGMTGEEADKPAAITTVRPLSGEIVGSYAMDALSYNETTQDWRTHNGIDIAAALGCNVTAARDGTVTAVYDDNSFGKTVVLTHGDGYVTHYANLAVEVPVSVGSSLKSGDVLGTVGDTATTELGEDPHLHFAVYHNNEPMNPETFLG